jgi:hypothetical protein
MMAQCHFWRNPICHVACGFHTQEEDILQRGAVYVVRGGELYRKGTRAIQKGRGGLLKSQEWGKE